MDSFFFFFKVNAKLTFCHFISPLGVLVLIMNVFSPCYQVCLMVLGETDLKKHAENAVLSEFQHFVKCIGEKIK